MSYNISIFKVKRLENLKCPVASFYKYKRKELHPVKAIWYDNSVTFTSFASEWSGRIIGDDFHFHSIDCVGEGSGTTINFILEPALKDSTGILEVVCIWEDGHSINRLIVEDGNVKWEEIEL